MRVLAEDLRRGLAEVHAGALIPAEVEPVQRIGPLVIEGLRHTTPGQLFVHAQSADNRGLFSRHPFAQLAAEILPAHRVVSITSGETSLGCASLSIGMHSEPEPSAAAGIILSERVADEGLGGYSRFQLVHALEQTDEAWERCALSLPLGTVVTGTVIELKLFGVFLDIGVAFPALLPIPLFPPGFDTRAGEAPPIGSTVRAVVVSHESKQLRVSALPEHLADPHQFDAHLFALVSAENGQPFIWFPGFSKRDWQAGDLIPWGLGHSLSVVRMIDPERDDQLPVLIVESAVECEPPTRLAGPLGRLPG